MRFENTLDCTADVFQSSLYNAPGSSSGRNVQMDLRLEYTPRIAASPEHHPIPRDRVTAPSSTHVSALAIPGERTGVAAKLGDRRFFKVALPETASSHNFSFRLSGRSLDSGQSERQFKFPCLFFYAFPPLFFCCTGVQTSLSAFLSLLFSAPAVRTSTAVVLLYAHGFVEGVR